MKENKVSMEKIVNLCKTRGFVFPGSEIYDGFANTWDFGPLGVELENNIKKLIPTEKEFLIAKEDLEKPEEERYYFTFAYLPQSATLEECESLYEEIDKIDLEDK